MILTRIRATKDLSIPRHDAELSIEETANDVRARFATPGKHAIYDRKLQEATRYLDAVASGNTPANLKKYPYMAKEVGPGKTAQTPEALATLWVTMNAAWEDASSTIEEISITAKAAVRSARSGADIQSIVAEARDKLGKIGTPPPPRPRKSQRP